MTHTRLTRYRALLLGGALGALLGIASCADNKLDRSGCTGSCADANSFLTVDDIKLILARGVAEAQAQNVNATFAVTDRVGNVLAVLQMKDASDLIIQPSNTVLPNARNGTVTTTPDGINPIDGGLENLTLPGVDLLGSISKAVTGAYLSSEGNAFTTRTASQIVQEHFNPGEFNQPGGPLFGVQFSQLPCSDLSRRFNGTGPDVGPKRSPLGLSADSGGLPIFKNGTPVGGIGVIADALYSLDKNITGGLDNDVDEIIALAAISNGFTPPANRRADQITVDGKVLRFTDADVGDFRSNPASITNPAAFDQINDAANNAGDDNNVARLVLVPGYYDPTGNTIFAGTAFGQPASGIRPATRPAFAALDGFVLVDENDNVRFPPINGTDAADLGSVQPLTAAEVEQILASGLDVANRARAQIRRPLSTPARVSLFVVDTNGAILGMVRGRDAPIFGIDVSLQKARTAAFFSSNKGANRLNNAPVAKYLDPATNVDGNGFNARVLRLEALEDYVTDVRTFLGNPTALGDGAVAFADRSGGNLSRPFFPDGIDGRPHGPFSKPEGEWSPFSTGLQLDMSYNAVANHIAFIINQLTPINVTNLTETRDNNGNIVRDANGDIVTTTSTVNIAAGTLGDVPLGCAGATAFSPAAGTITELANGLQIFPGSVPIYRGNTLIGGIGISGDGIDQDDMISFLGLHNAGQILSTVNNAPPAIRADTLTPQGVRLRYVNCPQAPFIDSDEQEVCDGK